MSRFCVWVEDKDGQAIAVGWTECKRGQTAINRLLKSLTKEEHDRAERAEARVPDFYDIDFIPGEADARQVFLNGNW